MAKKQICCAWFNPVGSLEKGFEAINNKILNIADPLFIIDIDNKLGACTKGTLISDESSLILRDCFKMLCYAAPQHPMHLGSPIFKKRYNINYAYVAGDMANGISSVELVKAAGTANMLGFFGSAGLKTHELKNAIARLRSETNNISFGINLIHAAGSPSREFNLVDLFLNNDIHLISAAGYLRMSAPLVYYRLKGLHRTSDGIVSCRNHIIAKASRVEVARLFLSPPPEKIVRQLREQKMITETEAELSQFVPMADDLTVEADSAGHTDNRPAISLLPSMINLRDQLYRQFNYPDLPCIGLAGGIGTPMAVAAAFILGADYVLTGSINQACIESGTSDDVRNLLSVATQTDVAMAPAADMFERGIRVQVLKYGTMFPQRAAKLYEIYRQYDSLNQIPHVQRKEIEEKILQRSFDEEWEQTRNFFSEYDPQQIDRAEKDPKYQMALVFRSYLGKSSRWAINGDPLRKKDYQIWCGPSMGAFNEWSKGSFLEKPENRDFTTIAMNLLYGACVALRRQIIINSGIFLPPEIGKFHPLLLAEIKNRLANQ